MSNNRKLRMERYIPFRKQGTSLQDISQWNLQLKVNNNVFTNFKQNILPAAKHGANIKVRQKATNFAGSSIIRHRKCDRIYWKQEELDILRRKILCKDSNMNEGFLVFADVQTEEIHLYCNMLAISFCICRRGKRMKRNVFYPIYSCTLGVLMGTKKICSIYVGLSTFTVCKCANEKIFSCNVSLCICDPLKSKTEHFISWTFKQVHTCK
jgi:hypothetical protein